MTVSSMVASATIVHDLFQRPLDEIVKAFRLPADILSLQIGLTQPGIIIGMIRSTQAAAKRSPPSRYAKSPHRCRFQQLPHRINHTQPRTSRGVHSILLTPNQSQSPLNPSFEPIMTLSIKFTYPLPEAHQNSTVRLPPPDRHTPFPVLITPSNRPSLPPHAQSPIPRPSRSLPILHPLTRSQVSRTSCPVPYVPTQSPLPPLTLAHPHGAALRPACKLRNPHVGLTAPAPRRTLTIAARAHVCMHARTHVYEWT